MNGEYAISVITPFHNVDMAFFDKAIRSMREQTVGFANIQWIVVLHNCEEKYAPLLKERLGGFPNVILTELHDATATPSAPRNRGFTLATAPYVGYLDADDSYKPDCLEECLRNARETDAQVVCFRREYELDDESLGSMTEIVLWNQLKKRIVIERGNWEEMQKIFDGLFSFVTSKVFDRLFLLSRRIAFDEEIPYCEDSLYSMCALAEANRVCVLPQLIGYHYFINGASIVQSNRKDSKTLVAYARGLVKIFRRGYDLGIDINFFAQRLILHVCRFMLHSDVLPEDQEEIRQLFAPIIYRTTPVKPNKIVTAEWSDMAFRLCHEMFLSTSSYRDNKALREIFSGLQNLQRILSRNKDSDYGRDCQFANIQTIAAYQFRVPLTRIASYRKLVDLQVSIGEHGILTSDRLIGYVRTEGDMVPFTEEHLKPYVLAIAKTLKGHHNLWIAQCELSGRMLNDRTRVHSLDSVIVRGYFFDCIYGGGERPATFSAPDGAFFFAMEQEADYALILHHALLDREIDQIVAADATRVRQMFQPLEDDAPTVLALLRAVDPVRADEVEAAWAELGSGVPFARRLWPKLKRVVACGSGRHAAAREHVRKFVGDTTWNNGYVFLPEMVLAHAVADDSERYVFDATGCFCEFFRNDSDDVSRPVTQSALEVGRSYTVIVTNGAGLYRVVTDIEIRVLASEVERLEVEIL